MRVAAAPFAFVLAAACAPGDIDLEGKACPCAVGWVCDEIAQVCRRGARDGGGEAAVPGMDAAATDGGVAEDAARLDVPDRDGGGPDSGGVDAGDTDSGGTDAGLDDTACDDALSGVLFCDGFETAGFPGWDTTRETDGRVTRATGTTWRGAGALRAETLAPAGQANLFTLALPAVGSGELWARVYLFVPSGAAFVDVNVLSLHEDASPFLGVAFGVRDGERPYVFASTESASYAAPTVRLVRDRWICVLLHVTVDDTAGAVELSLDGDVAVARTAIDTRPGAGFSYLVAGIGYSDPAQPPIEIYLDELAVDDAPLACD